MAVHEKLTLCYLVIPTMVNPKLLGWWNIKEKNMRDFLITFSTGLGLAVSQWFM